ncbi:MAG: hypothetical protein ACO3BJ_07745 [Burkholderiaceae bacterium]
MIVTPELRHWFASQSQPVLGKDWRQSNPAKAAAFPTARPGFFVDIDSEDDLNAFNAGQKPEDRLAMPLGH